MIEIDEARRQAVLTALNDCAQDYGISDDELILLAAANLGHLIAYASEAEPDRAGQLYGHAVKLMLAGLKSHQPV